MLQGKKTTDFYFIARMCQYIHMIYFQVLYFHFLSPNILCFPFLWLHILYLPQTTAFEMAASGIATSEMTASLCGKDEHVNLM